MLPSVTRFFDAAAGQWATWMVDMAWQSAILVAVLLIAEQVYRRASARLLHTVWLLILLRLFVPPATAFPTGIAWWVRPATTQMQVVADQTTNTPSGRLDGRTSSPRTQPTIVRGDSSWSTPPSPTSFPWLTLALLTWGTVVATRLGMLTTAWLTIRRWVNEARVIEDQRLLGVWHSACKKASITSPPGLRDSQSCSTPLVVGTWSPTVLIPSSVLECLHDDELETVFIHELMHVRRHDASIRMAASLMGAIYFLLPWVWIANWRLRRLCEDACDETTVIALRGRRKSYGSAILKTAEIIGYEPPRFALGMRDSHRSPRQRLERLLDARLPLHPTSTLRTTCLLTVMALVLLPGGARPPLTRAADRGTDASASVAPIKPPIVLDPATTEARPPLKEEPIGPATDSTTTEPRQATDATTLSSRQLVVMFLDPLRRPGWIERLRKMPDAESVGASLLTHEHAEVRIAALLVLQATGTPQSLPGVEHAYLHGKTREQSAAKATLNAIWQRVRAELPQQKSIQNSVRIFD